MPKPPRCSDQLEADGSESDSKSTDDNVTYSSNASTSGSSSLRGESLSDSENEDDPFDHLDNLRQPMEGQGESCEIRVFDSLVDATGQRLVLQTAQKSDLALGPDREGPAALVLTRVYDRFKRLSRTVLEIRSQYMKEAMRQVIKTYPGLNIDSGGHIVTFDEPRCLFHYRKELEEFASNSDDSKTRRHVKFCLQYMAKTLREDISAYDTMMKGNLNSARPGLDFDRLWMAFKPGDLVFHKVDGDEVISQLVDMRKFSTKAPSTSHWEVAVQRMEWEVTVQRMESNGKVLGYTTVDIVIPSYDGFREFTKLNVFPLDLHQEKERLIQDVLHRSQKFVSLCDLHHCQHDGVADIYPVDMRISYIPQSAKYECFSTRVKVRISFGRVSI
jgi:hypothetical protein